MNKIFTLSAVAALALSAGAATPTVKAGACAVKSYGSAVTQAAGDYEVFYPYCCCNSSMISSVM